MDKLAALVKVEWYEDYEGKIITDYIILTEVEDFSDAMKRIEEYYANDLESVLIKLFEGSFLRLTEDMFK